MTVDMQSDGGSARTPGPIGERRLRTGERQRVMLDNGTARPGIRRGAPMDYATGEMRWYFQFPNRNAFFYVLDLRWEFPVDSRTTSGLLSTAGDLVFGGTADGFFFALDAETGEELWHRNIGGRVHAAPMAFAVDGRQHVAIAAGNAIFAFALP